MSTASILLFMAASLPIVLFPGPSVGFILATTLRSGRLHGLWATAGVETGYLVHVVAAVAGISALLAASSTAFGVVKVVGACWLIWLAIKSWRSKSNETLAGLSASERAAQRPIDEHRYGPEPLNSRGSAAVSEAEKGRRLSAEPASEIGRGSWFRKGFLIGALNPKTAIFFVAFLPQFVVPGQSVPTQLQLLAFGLTFVAMASVPDACWAVVGSHLRRFLPRVRVRTLDRVSAFVYGGLAIITLTARRSTGA